MLLRVVSCVTLFDQDVVEDLKTEFCVLAGTCMTLVTLDRIDSSVQCSWPGGAPMVSSYVPVVL